MFLFGFGRPKKHTCKTKVRYRNEIIAREALKRINPKSRRGKPFRTYKCPDCAGYHLSSKPARR